MTNKRKRAFGRTLAILGMSLPILNAVDYVIGWNQISSAVSAIGLMLAVIGAVTIRHSV